MINKKIVAALSAFFLIGCLLSYTVYNLKPNIKNDVIEINRIYKEVTNNWENLNHAGYSNFLYPFCVLSNNGNILYKSSDKAIIDISSALQNGDIVMDIEYQDKIAGKLIITTDNSAYFKITQKKLSLIIFAVFSLLTVLSFIYYFYLYINIIKPFKSLEQFAKEISSGNLDFTLEMNKNNIFGSFTQSFDMMREQLSTTKRQEFLANQSKKELVASLSHDIKTPITSIKLTSELLMVTVKDEKVKTKLNTIYQKAEQINLLVTDLFNAALDDLEQLSISPVETYSSVLKAIILEAGCYDKITLHTIPDCLIYADIIRLNQVIVNVIYNSYKYADTMIDINFELNNGYLELHIQDFGKGVDEDDLPLIFNKFYRGKNAAAKSGSGLGLYICKKILEEMDGEIYCSNNTKGFLTLILLKLA